MLKQYTYRSVVATLEGVTFVSFGSDTYRVLVVYHDDVYYYDPDLYEAVTKPPEVPTWLPDDVKSAMQQCIWDGFCDGQELVENIFILYERCRR